MRLCVPHPNTLLINSLHSSFQSKIKYEFVESWCLPCVQFEQGEDEGWLSDRARWTPRCSRKKNNIGRVWCVIYAIADLKTRECRKSGDSLCGCAVQREEVEASEISLQCTHRELVNQPASFSRCPLFPCAHPINAGHCVINVAVIIVILPVRIRLPGLVFWFFSVLGSNWNDESFMSRRVVSRCTQVNG